MNGAVAEEVGLTAPIHSLEEHMSVWPSHVFALEAIPAGSFPFQLDASSSM